MNTILFTFKIIILLQFILFTTTFLHAQTVYVAGAHLNANRISVATLWENGEALALSEGTKEAYANSVYVSGDDVYAAGSVGEIAVYWKNGERHDLMGDNSFANSIFVSGNDVYVAGGHEEIATIWKNGTTEHLTDQESNSEALSIFVADSDVYVAGYKIVGTLHVATLWKNSIPQSLNDENGNTEAYAESVYVSGNDVYVAGWETDESERATLWKNGVKQDLKSASSANAFSVFAMKDNTYVVGFKSSSVSSDALLWINNIEQKLQFESFPTIANSVYVTDKKIATQEVHKAIVTCFPNPMTDIVHFNSKEFIEEVRIYSIFGQMMFSSIIHSKSTEIDVSHIPAGIYIAEVHTIQGNQRLRLVKK